MLLTAPGKTSQTPTVATVSIAPVDLAAASSARIKLRRRCQRVFAAGHQLAAGVAAFALDHDAQAGRRGNVRHQAEVDSFLFQQRTLLDVQFDKLMKASSGQRNGFERAGESGLRAQFFQAAALLVAQRERLLPA